MTTGYTPREGDRIKVELTLGKTPGDPGWFAPGFGAIDPEWLINAGVSVELVARAEPDWQPGDIGQHIETGELYWYVVTPGGGMPWMPLNPKRNRRWFSRDELAGKLRRMRLVPEDEAPAGERFTLHQHERCHVVPQVGDGGTNVGADEEPPTGRYQDAAGATWRHDTLGWYTVYDDERYRWSTIRKFGPFTPLFTAAELVPDPADDEAVTALQIAAGHTSPQGPIRDVLRVLRARAEARGGAA